MTFAILGGASASLSLTDESNGAIRFAFNPSSLDSVNRIKTLTSALIAELQAQQKAKPEAAREFAVAITNAQTTSMWAVSAATKGL
jgi:hypothetical protein